jgi:hypothetical protein
MLTPVSGSTIIQSASEHRRTAMLCLDLLAVSLKIPYRFLERVFGSLAR